MGIPTDARVVAVPMIGEPMPMTFGEACNLWKDARHFNIEGALLKTGYWRANGLTIRLHEFKLGGWTITYDPPPIPVRDMDWHFVHDDFDASYEGEEDGYVSNGLGGSAASPEACLSEIAEIERSRLLSAAEKLADELRAHLDGDGE